MNRRQSLGLILGGVAAGMISTKAIGKPETTSLELGANRDPQLGAQMSIAVTKGFFKDEGLDVTVHWTQTSGDLQPLVAGGALNVATLGMHQVVPMRSLGVPLRALCSLCEYSGSQGLVLSPGKKLSSPADLVGKRIAVPNESPHEMALVKLGKQYNFDASKIILVRMQPAESVSAAARGDVDGVLTFQPYLYKLLQLGGTLYFTGGDTYFKGTQVELPADDRLLYICSTLAVNENWVASNKNTAAALVRTMIRATNFILQQPAEAQKVMQDFFHADAEALHQAMVQNRYQVAIDPTLQRSVAFADAWLTANKKIPTAIPAADTVYPAILQAIDPKLVTWKA